MDTDFISSVCLPRSEIAGSDQIVVLFLIFQGTSLVFATITVLIYILQQGWLLLLPGQCLFSSPPEQVEGSHVFIFLFKLLYKVTFNFFFMVILTGAK